ncbi:signal peptidase I [Microbacterium halophytorum]|uniref:signal peptidase I n=1 Tax=Microbacterium halophytorum TaxID=2067568 RepID=UPI000CFDFE37|nr:signal peptidase I [Microbacterium halophytorum]
MTTATAPLAPIRHRGAAPRTGSRRALRIAGDILLWIAAAVGTLCVLLAVLGAFFGFRVMLFSTGSMEPTIPTGSAALVMPIAAENAAVGDVVTVERGDDQLPVTHRVVANDPVAGSDARALTLRGDANAANDPSPYEATEVGRVLFSVPGVAPAIAAIGDARVLGPIAIAATGLVVWGLWPRPRADRR